MVQARWTPIHDRYIKSRRRWCMTLIRAKERERREAASKAAAAERRRLREEKAKATCSLCKGSRSRSPWATARSHSVRQRA